MQQTTQRMQQLRLELRCCGGPSVDPSSAEGWFFCGALERIQRPLPEWRPRRDTAVRLITCGAFMEVDSVEDVYCLICPAWTGTLIACEMDLLSFIFYALLSVSPAGWMIKLSRASRQLLPSLSPASCNLRVTQ